jgi:hypothetical protein
MKEKTGNFRAWKGTVGALLGICIACELNLSAFAQSSQLDPALEARLAKEKEDRKACKIEICKAFASPTEGTAINCSVTKTWLSDEIQAGFLGDRLSWPWGNARCSSTIDLDRTALKEAALSPSATLKLKKHTVTCELEGKDSQKGDRYEIKLSIEPVVTFEKGRAKSVTMGWNNIEAPLLAKTAIWSATAVDANFNVLSSGIVKQINGFLDIKCKEEGIEVKRGS